MTSDATASEPVKPGAGTSGSAGSKVAETERADTGTTAETAAKADAGKADVKPETADTPAPKVAETASTDSAAAAEVSTGSPVRGRKHSDTRALPSTSDSGDADSAVTAADAKNPDTADSKDTDSKDADPSDTEAVDEPRATPAKPRSNQLVLTRPPEMILGAVFLTLSALPLVLAGLGLMLQLGQIGPNLARIVPAKWPTVDVGSVILLVRVAGFLLLLIGLVFIALTWFALKPRRWARAGATIFAAIEALLLIVAMLLTASDPVSLGLILLAAAGAALLYLPRSEEFLLAQ